MAADAELLQLSSITRNYLKTHFVDFLERKHSTDLMARVRHKLAGKHMKPFEAFELEIKSKLSSAAHEIMHAIQKIEDSKKARSKEDLKLMLRYARESLGEAGKELDAADTLYKNLETYEQRLYQESSVLSHEVRPVMDDLYAKMEQLRSLQHGLYENVAKTLGVEK